MLNIDVLKQLKADMLAQKATANGIVRFNEKGSGWIYLEQGKKKVHLPLDEAKRVFSGDRVAICIEKTKNKPAKSSEYAQLVTLLSSSVDDFTGYVTRHQDRVSILPDKPTLFGNTLLLPKALSMGAQPGDYVHAQLEKHPFDTGYATAKVTRIIGQEHQIGIESQYIMAKYAFPKAFPKAVQDQAKTLHPEQIDALSDQYTDLTHRPFITIDNASSTDLDDALYAQTTAQGWELQVAIADASAWVAPDSPIDCEAQKRGTSTYLIGQVCPMLPMQLSEHLCSLLPQQKRLAMVCTMHIDSSGNITHFQFEQAVICSQAQLNYPDISHYLATQDTEAFQQDRSLQTHITTLHDVSRALYNDRAQQHLVHDDKPEYQLILNDKKHVKQIIKTQRSLAQKLVEECMVATNRCAASLMQHADSGLFVSHSGVREERKKMVAALLKEHQLESPKEELNVRQFCAIMHTLKASPDKQPVYETLKRHLNATQLTTTVKAHFGMGLTCYTTATSPIRKYADLCVQRMIKAIINSDQAAFSVSKDLCTQLHHATKSSRRAALELTQWLTARYLTKQDSNALLTGQITGLSSASIQIKLDDSGLEGIIKNHTLKEKYQFDIQNHQLRIAQHTFTLGEKITVRLFNIKQHYPLPQKIGFQWVPNTENLNKETS